MNTHVQALSWRVSSREHPLKCSFVLRVPVLLSLWVAAAWAQNALPPLVVDIEGVKLRPGGFLDLMGMERSATTTDNVYTHFGAIPLTPTPGETLVSVSHSRVQLRGDSQ